MYKGWKGCYVHVIPVLGSRSTGSQADLGGSLRLADQPAWPTWWASGQWEKLRLLFLRYCVGFAYSVGNNLGIKLLIHGSKHMCFWYRSQAYVEWNNGRIMGKRETVSLVVWSLIGSSCTCKYTITQAPVNDPHKIHWFIKQNKQKKRSGGNGARESVGSNSAKRVWIWSKWIKLLLKILWNLCMVDTCQWRLEIYTHVNEDCISEFWDRMEGSWKRRGSSVTCLFIQGSVCCSGISLHLQKQC